MRRCATLEITHPCEHAAHRSRSWPLRAARPRWRSGLHASRLAQSSLQQCELRPHFCSLLPRKPPTTKKIMRAVMP